MNKPPFTVVRGRAVPLLRANVDTDVIIRIERLMLARDQLRPYTFEAIRRLPDGSEDPDCLFNQPEFRDAPFLLAGPNFGCGSSREYAVWALQAIGVRCVMAPSFGDIFHANCFPNGVLPIRLPLEQVEMLAGQCALGEALEVDLERGVILAPDGARIAFDIDPARREGLLHGLDDIGLTMRDDAAIRAWQAADRAARPWAWPDEAAR